jgi:CheY-like chemotaxis protein
LTVTFPRDPITIDADATRIAQVFSNLLNNAAKYTPRGGHITVSAECDGDAATICVRDTGIGIPAEMLTRVFDMFVQVDRSFEKTSGGLGIGLTLVRRLVEMHGGTIQARSAGTGTGSEFIVTLPAVVSPRSLGDQRSVRVRAVSTGNRRKILVADDNEDAAQCLAEALRLMGHDVQTVADGAAAVAIAEADGPEVVLLDLGMPRMDGYEAARRIRSRFGQKVLIVAVSGWGQHEDQRRSREAGFDRHLVKPVDLSDVVALVEALPARVF